MTSSRSIETHNITLRCCRETAITRQACLRTRRLHHRTIKISVPPMKPREQWFIKTEKMTCWQELCRDVDLDPWKLPHKTIMDKIKPSDADALSSRAFLDKILFHSFPQHRKTKIDIGLSATRDVTEPSHVTEAKVKKDRQEDLRSLNTRSR